MDCQEFELIVMDLAREALDDAAILKNAHAHAATCPSCAQKLARERRLTDALQAVARADWRLTAPAHLEANLLNAFRAQAEQAATPKSDGATTNVNLVRQNSNVATPNSNVVALNSNLAPSNSNLVPLVSHQTHKRRMATIGVASAGLLAACLALALFFAPRAGQTPNALVKEAQTNASTPIQSAPPIAIDKSPDISRTANLMSDNPREVKSNKFAVRASMKGLRSPRAPARGDFQMARRNGAADVTRSGDGEIATDFLMLTPTTAEALEGGQIVRVELSPSALVNFGVMMNAGSASEKVKADVVLSADGVARAIRFVR